MFGKPYCSYQKVFLTFSEHDCLPPVQSLLSNDLFAALKEVIAAKSRAARQQKFSSPTRLSSCLNATHLIATVCCIFRLAIFSCCGVELQNLCLCGVSDGESAFVERQLPEENDCGPVISLPQDMGTLKCPEPRLSL